mmetsp:Transcript_93164/g.170801  ORF Transcript_93164/g.170801 Transcript_93164/m.170801 type:complete len:97 (-) Transcript_93164:285-575(-)
MGNRAGCEQPGDTKSGEQIEKLPPDVQAAEEVARDVEPDPDAAEKAKRASARLEKQTTALPAGASYTGQWVGQQRDGKGIQVWASDELGLLFKSNS